MSWLTKRETDHADAARVSAAAMHLAAQRHLAEVGRICARRGIVITRLRDGGFALRGAGVNIRIASFADVRLDALGGAP